MTDSARALAQQVREGTRSATQVVEETLELIEAKDPDINAFNFVSADLARRRAEEIDQRVANGEDPGPLAGVPVALKDNICTSGIPTTCSSRILEGWRPPYDATVVRRLVDAGAVPIGKTNMDEFAMGSSTETSAFGPTRNPRDPSRVPGGSSGGSAAAVAAGMTPLALGSDTGGSVRQPAALCGVVGVKPTYGRVSRYGLVAFASSLDQIGPFATNVADAALLLEVISGYDRLDSTSIPERSYDAPRRDSRGRWERDSSGQLKTYAVRGVEPDTLLPATECPPKGMQVGLVSELLGDGVNPDVTERVRAAAKALEAVGAHVREVSIPALSDALSAYYLIAQAEASSNLARYDGVRYGLRLDAEDVERVNAETRSAGFGAEVKRRIMLGTFALSAGYYDAYYVKAQKVRTQVIKDFTAAYNQGSIVTLLNREHCDVLLAPTSPSVAFKLGERLDDPLQMYFSDVCTVPSNLSGQPAISLPFGTGADGLPVGVQILAPLLREDAMFCVAAALERACPTAKSTQA